MRTISLILEEENIRAIKEKMDKGESFIKIDKKIEQIPQSLTSEIIRALIVENEIGVLKSIINSNTSFVNSLLQPSNIFPLSIAMDADNEKIAEQLHSNGANLLSIISDMPDKYKKQYKNAIASSFMDTIKSSNIDVVKKCVSESISLINIKDICWNTPLHVAVLADQTERVRYFSIII